MEDPRILELEGALLDLIDWYRTIEQPTDNDIFTASSVHALLEALQQQTGHSTTRIKSYSYSAWAV